MHEERDIVRAGIQANWLDPKWYVLFVRSNQEKRVAQHLSSRAIEYFLPAYESEHQWRDRKIKLLSPLFPGYIFVKLPFTERSRVLLVPNVVNLVGTRNAPSLISDEEIESIRLGITHGKAKPHRYLSVGDWVVIKTGAMAGMQGILIRMQNGTRVLIRLNVISRAFAVEVDSSWVELAARSLRLQRGSEKTGPPEVTGNVVSTRLDSALNLSQ